MKRYSKIIKTSDGIIAIWDNYVVHYILKQQENGGNGGYVLHIKHGNNLNSLKPLEHNNWYYKTKKEAKKAIWNDISETIYNYNLFVKEVL